MCPLRIILVFLSGILAGYLAWKSLRFDPSQEDDSSSHTEEFKRGADQDDESSQRHSFLAKASGTVVGGFWTFVDMASGRFLWRNLAANSSQQRSS